MTGLIETYGMRHAAKALAWYDATEAEREALFAKMEKTRTTGGAQRAFDKWNRAAKDAERKVKEAFYEDTRDRNNRDCVNHVSFGFIREMVAKYPPK